MTLPRRLTLLAAAAATALLTTAVASTDAAPAAPGPRPVTDPAALTTATGDVVVPPGTTLRLAAGRTLRLPAGASIVVQGTLVARGTAAAPVVLGASTSTRWSGVRVEPVAGRPAPVADLQGVEVSGAQTALTALAGGTVTLRGSVHDVGWGVAGGDAYVDARGVDWGSPTGPSPVGRGAGTSGVAVATSPWAGAPAVATTSSRRKQTRAVGSPCPDLLVLGLRGSGEQPQLPLRLWPVDPTGRVGFGGFPEQVVAGLTAAVTSADPTAVVQPVAVRYPATAVPHSLFDAASYPAFRISLADGVAMLQDRIAREHTACGAKGTRVAVVGYSQGALVAHLALAELARTRPDLVTPTFLAGAVLVSDPARVAGGAETLWQTGAVAATAALRATTGAWPTSYPALTPALPAAVAARTLSLCHVRDVVCTSVPGASAASHTTYPGADLGAAGAWLARR